MCERFAGAIASSSDCRFGRLYYELAFVKVLRELLRQLLLNAKNPVLIIGNHSHFVTRLVRILNFSKLF
ncbi:hypothetical protein CKA32_002721 [Geitlerinema sp. FC II]|nr:hypothetical protein CKA32_002721 [Geitlerinema sp. FC II]